MDGVEEPEQSMTTIKTDVNINDLAERVQRLEINDDITTNHTEFLLEMVKIITEIPAGKQIYNRALNRQSLNRLRRIVLPRRQKYLQEFFGEGEQADMPEEVKDKFVADEMRLIRGVIRSIQHREHYETKSAETVRKVLTTLFTKVIKSKTPKVTMVKKQVPYHPKSGGRNARTQ
jgi:hypothetical protein